jgi:hypothetical protein
MKGMSMFLLLAILGSGLVVCAADGIAICRQPVRPPQTFNSRVRTTGHRVPAPLTPLRRQA